MIRLATCIVAAIFAAACGRADRPMPVPEYFGTLEPFASEAVYFVMTDRFVDGDPGNNQPEQGGPDLHTFDRPVVRPDGERGNIGYLGGDFRGLLDNADYIAGMGFTAVWVTPIVENPDEAFTGGLTLDESPFADRGKTGFHGYWGVNFYEEDEHLVSAGLDFAELTRQLGERHGLKTVLDIVCNHGSPAYTMPEDQPMYGEIYDGAGRLVADHQNLRPEVLDPANPLHAFYHREPDLAQLGNIDDTNPAVLDYFVGAYLQWIDAGAAAFRIDTIRHMPHAYWKQFSDRIRAVRPGFFMFGESFDYDAENIATHTYTGNGGISVLDFPGKAAIDGVFASDQGDYADLEGYLHLEDGVYRNPYDLMTFYDNHDMPRMAASPTGFIDAHNWLFTSRGIPVIYYGSETAFRAGKSEHGGNRDYFGQDRINAARDGEIRAALSAVAGIRKHSPALQRGLQANLELAGDAAVFYRVYQKDGVNQTALVVLNKGALAVTKTVARWLSPGTWVDAAGGPSVDVDENRRPIDVSVPAHGVRVLFFNGPVDNADFAARLTELQAGARAREGN